MECWHNYVTNLNLILFWTCDPQVSHSFYPAELGASSVITPILGFLVSFL